MDGELIDALNRVHKLAGKTRKMAKHEIPRLQDALHAARRGDKQHIVEHYLADTMEALQQLADQAYDIEHGE